MLGKDYNKSKIQVTFDFSPEEERIAEILVPYTQLPKISRTDIVKCQYALIKAGFKGNARW